MLEDGFYWVKARVDGKDTWLVAEYEYGKWKVPGRERRFKTENFLEVDERPIKRKPDERSIKHKPVETVEEPVGEPRLKWEWVEVERSHS